MLFFTLKKFSFELDCPAQWAMKLLQDAVTPTRCCSITRSRGEFSGIVKLEQGTFHLFAPQEINPQAFPRRAGDLYLTRNAYRAVIVGEIIPDSKEPQGCVVQGTMRMNALSSLMGITVLLSMLLMTGFFLWQTLHSTGFPRWSVVLPLIFFVLSLGQMLLWRWVSKRECRLIETMLRSLFGAPPAA